MFTRGKRLRGCLLAVVSRFLGAKTSWLVSHIGCPPAAVAVAAPCIRFKG